MKQARNIGLIGLGYWGKNILRNLYELEILRTACDENAEIIAERRERFPEIDYTGSVDEVMGDPEIKALVIATPAATHYRLVKEALLAGKDVLVEKPLSLTVKEGTELVETAAREKRILMVGHILQYHPAVIKIKEMIAEGRLGRIQYVYSNRLNIGKLRTEENILWSFAPHDISVILMLMGEEPVKVSASGGDYLTKGIYDTTMTALEFRNGVRGHIFVSWLHPFKEQKLVVVGSRGLVVFDDVSREKLLFYAHKINWKQGKIPVAEKAEHEHVPLEKGEPLKEELKHFADCVKTRKSPKTDGREGLRVLKVLEAAEKRFSLPAPEIKSSPGYFVHESACLDADVSISPKVKIWHFSHILKGSEIGEGSILGQNVVVGPDVVVGRGCKVQNNVSVYKGVVLEDEVFCGPSCVFTNVYNPRAFIERKHEFLRTLVKKGATIGANATIVCGTTIGRYSLIGAGAVVKADVPDYAVMVGVPARQTGWVCRCGVSLSLRENRGVCHDCGKKFILENQILKEET
ncbi:MAG: Gfo/Idh/MocA family oxidoreductase [bacterium]